MVEGAGGYYYNQIEGDQKESIKVVLKGIFLLFNCRTTNYIHLLLVLISKLYFDEALRFNHFHSIILAICTTKDT